MERNANDDLGSQNSGESTTSSFGAGTGSQAGSQGSPSDASFSRDTMADTGNLADRAKNAASTAGEKLSGVGSTVRDKAGNLKSSLADVLESGAEKLRAQGAGGGQLAGAAATGESTGMIADQSNRMAGATNQLAGGLQASADWLRDADLDGMKTGIERQVKEHPGRTLAIAVGAGYLLGKAFRR
jgi:ElaB/YqjD/DUF883 family membrane-anchored ribosome-binding protein